MIIFVGHSWIYQITDAETRFRGFLIPLMLSACIFSNISQSARDRFGRRRTHWLLLANPKESEIIAAELEYESEDLRARTAIRDSYQASINTGGSSYQTDIAVGDMRWSENEKCEELLRTRERGECVVPLIGWCEQELQRIPPELVHPEWLIQADGFELRPGTMSWRIKRFGDVVGACALIIITAPLIVIGGVFIWVEDRGPIFYQQIRTGLYGSPICIWKLRSMKVNAEESGAQWSSKADPRVTRVGKVIRALRIDELPQLVSVLNGDLSLIGPRPERPEIEEDLIRLVPNYRIRHWVRPGLSGWAQVCFPYGASVEDSRKKLSYDLYYLRNASLLLDVLITMKTIRLVANARGSTPLERQRSNLAG